MSTEDPATEEVFSPKSDVGLTPEITRGHTPREIMVRKLADIVVLPASRLTASQRSFVADIMIEALSKVEEDLRLEVSRRVARVAEAPSIRVSTRPRGKLPAREGFGSSKLHTNPGMRRVYSK